jgi:hypothetical protein
VLAAVRVTRQPVVTDGPYGETKELFGGYYILDVPTQNDAVEWAKRMPMTGPGFKTEIRRVTSIDEFLQDNEWWRSSALSSATRRAGRSLPRPGPDRRRVRRDPPPHRAEPARRGPAAPRSHSASRRGCCTCRCATTGWGADPRGGSGLIGLRDRVEALGGTIEVKSPPGTGTTVLVTMPVG